MSATRSTSVKPGDLVSIPFQVSCGECAACRAGRTGNCESVPRLSMYGLPVGPQTYGGFASDAVNVPYADAMLVPIPDGVEPIGGRQPLRQHPGRLADRRPPAGGAPGSPVLIAMGAGSIALYSIAIALALGAERVDVVGGRERDRELAREARRERPRRGVPGPGRLLPDHGRRERRPRRASPAPCARPTPMGSAPASGSTSSRPRCRCSTCSPRGSPSSPAGRTCATLMPEVLELVRQGKFDPDPMTVNKVAWDDAAEALSDLRAKTVVLREGAA